MNRFIHLAILASGLLAPVEAKPQPAATPEGFLQNMDNSGYVADLMTVVTVTPKPEALIPTGADFFLREQEGFLKTRRQLVQAVDEDKSGLSLSGKNVAALLELSGFFLTYAMTIESRSILSALDEAELSMDQKAHKLGLSIAVNILDPWEMALSDQEINLLEGSREWPGHALFRSLYFIRKGEPKRAEPYLDRAAKDAATLGDGIQELALPQLLDAAIGLQDWAAAKEFAQLFSENENLRDGNAYQYLLGRTAEQGENYYSAFENYVKASEGDDKWAQRARLSLINMGLKTKSLSPEDARDMLQQSRFAWRGDKLAIRTLNRLVELELQLQDVGAALEVLGEIIYTNLDDAATQRAKQQANLLLQSYYDDGATGKLEISKFMLGHRRIAPDYRFQEGFSALSEQFADRLMEIGASKEAAIEYETTYNYLYVSQDLGLFEVSAEQLDGLRLKQVKALLRGGQIEEALPILAFGAQGNDPVTKDAYTFLKAELFLQNGDAKSFLEEKVLNPSASYLKIKAQAYFSLGDWASAIETYHTLWVRHEDSFQLTEALNMLLAAYRTKDAKLALELIKIFPDLTDAPQWHEIAAALFKEQEIAKALQDNAISYGISSAGRILDVMDIINMSSQ